MQQQKNLILFIILTVLILVGWQQLSSRLWPPRPRPIPEPTTVLAPEWNSFLAAVAMPGSGGVEAVGPAAADLAVADWSVHPENWLVKSAPEPKKAEVKKAEPAAPHYEVQLGDDQSSLKVTATTLGGGIEGVILNHYPQATSDGKPDGNPPKPLHLVPEEANQASPSNLLYLYQNENDKRPVDTLGKDEWELVSPKDPVPGTAYPEVVFAYRKLPNVDITKTYRLDPKAYHIELMLEFKYKGTGAKAAPLRYQLSAAHGLPIEGDWYTNVYRNALIGDVDGKGNVSRDLQDAQLHRHQGRG